MNSIAPTDCRFSSIGSSAKRIWSISAIHGEIDKLASLHDTIFPYIKAGDKIVYTGNYIGYGKNSSAVVDEILSFRRATLAKPSMIPSDLIYLRGAQEEIWQKLLQLQFSPDPTHTLLWMLGNGLTNTLYAYGISPHDGIEACRQGMTSISKWTKSIREALKSKAGHESFTTHLVRAAYTPEDSEYPMLFVHSGLDTTKPLTKQGDSFWWASKKFDDISESYGSFKKVIRGYDPTHKGIHLNCIKATIDGGCGFGGTLTCAVFEQNGTILDMLER